MSKQLLATIILPIRNEARYIARCLEGVLAQDYAREQIEILVVDGMSNDGTREVVNQFEAGDPRVRILDNPSQTVSAAINVGIAAARGDVVVRVDGHAVIAPDYVRQCVDTLVQTGADCVGGHMRPESDTFIGKAIALVYGSPFGLGGGKFHSLDVSGYADTVYMGAYRRDVFEKAGLFNEALIRNQDIEFNYRLRRHGAKIFLTPRIRSTYYSRSSLTELAQQNFSNGYWNIKTIRETPGALSMRHFVPMLFVMTLVFCIFFAFVIPQGWFLFAIVFAAYAIGVLYFSLTLSRRSGWQYLFALVATFPCLHFSYGVGSLVGLGRTLFDTQLHRRQAS